MAKRFRGNYESYLTSYYKQTEKLKRKGRTMYDDRPYSRTEFETMYRATRNDLIEEVKEGKRKTVGNVTQNIVRKQAYEFTDKQAKAMSTAAELTGQKLTYTQIRTGEFDWEQIKQARKDLLSAGIKKKEVALIIAQTYFGSD